MSGPFGRCWQLLINQIHNALHLRKAKLFRWCGVFFIACTFFIAEICIAGPWRIQDSIDSDTFRLSGKSLTRYESLDGQYRGGRGDSDQVVVFRNQLKAQFVFEGFSLVGEFMDARQDRADSGSPISTAVVNTSELIQSYLAYTARNIFGEGDELSFQLGRQTMDMGSRRLIASTRFRATENTFTGLRSDWRSDHFNATFFYFLPVTRLPSDPESLLDNEHQTDVETSHIRFFGGTLSTPSMLKGWTTELTALKLIEKDSALVPTSNFNITTVGGRIFNAPQKGSFYGEVETYYQWGSSHSSPLDSDTRSLDHEAWYGHLGLGYSFDVAMNPRLELLFDYASGDRNPTDGDNNRFHSLYGVTAFEFGPTGIYGAFARENLKSPGVGLTLAPAKDISMEVTMRHMSLASSKDAWTKAKLRDNSGGSGTDLGDQLEAKVVWDVLPGNLKFMVGFTNLFAGDFSENVSGDKFDTHYGYLQTVISF